MSSTLKDIARELGVSVSTISRVVNNKTYVNPKTRKIVLEGLKKFNYMPNQVARSLKKQSTGTVGIVVPDISENFFAQIIKGIDEVLRRKDISIILADSNESSQKEANYLKLLYQNRIDALILATVSKNHETLNMYSSNNIPVIFIDNIPDIDHDIDCVIINNKKASMLAVNHLIENNHRNIAIIVGSPDETTGYERLDGYRRAMEQHKIPVDEHLIQHGNYKEDSGYTCMKILLENRMEHPFTGLYVGSEMMTYGAIKAIKEYGLLIPDDIALVGFDVHDKSGLITPGITSVRQPETYIGKTVADLVVNRLKEKKNNTRLNQVYQHIVLEPFLEIRKSSGARET
jgi:DNA-binding LacI/PurR family transcriptional regulator